MESMSCELVGIDVEMPSRDLKLLLKPDFLNENIFLHDKFLVVVFFACSKLQT